MELLFFSTRFRKETPRGFLNPGGLLERNHWRISRNKFWGESPQGFPVDTPEDFQNEFLEDSKRKVLKDSQQALLKDICRKSLNIYKKDSKGNWQKLLQQSMNKYRRNFCGIVKKCKIFRRNSERTSISWRIPIKNHWRIPRNKDSRIFRWKSWRTARRYYRRIPERTSTGFLTHF